MPSTQSNTPDEPLITTVYTYRGGVKLPLEKSADQFVVRALPDTVRERGLADNVEQVSSASTRATVPESELEPMMAKSRNIAPTHHAYYVAQTHEEFLPTDRVLVTFKDDLPPEQVDEFAGSYGLLKTAAYSNRDFLFQLTDATKINPVKLVVKLNEEEPLVEIAEHDLNQRVNKREFTIPSDPEYVNQWHLHERLTNGQFDRRSSSRCEAAWRLLDSFGSADVVVGVTDDGCKLDHGDFNGTGKFAGWGYMRGQTLKKHFDVGAQASRMYENGADHGTSCAGVIAGEVDAVLTVGAAPGSRLLPIKWESSDSSLFISDSKLLTVLNFIADRVDVLSNSWGSTPTTSWARPVLDKISSLATSGGRRGKGILFLWAAGNENCPIQHSGTVEVPYDGGWDYINNRWTWVGVSTSRVFSNNLVGIPGVMHIAAIASNAQRSHYSNYGTGVELSAPSNNVHKYWRLTVPGLGITTATGEVGEVTADFGGTSSATPLVAGIAALVISANPALTALEVASILKRTASKDLNFQGYSRTPAANFDPNTSWDVSPVAPFQSGNFQNTGDPDGTWSPWFGHGRVDAEAAVREAINRRTSEITTEPPARRSHLLPSNGTSSRSHELVGSAKTGTVSAVKVLIDFH